MKVIINSPSLNPEINVSGISSVTQFIISNNKEINYIHFEIGRKDCESQKIISRIKRILENIKKWNKLLKENKKAFIHYNIPLMKAAIIRDYIMLRIAHKNNMPILLHVHGGNYLQNRKRPWYLKIMLRNIFIWSKHIVVLSEEEKKILKEDFKINNIMSLANCIDLSNAKKFKRDMSKKERLNILYIGRIERNKGIKYILEACKELNEKGIDFCLHFAGKEENPGEFIQDFEKCLKKRFIFHGIISGNKKTELFKSCDVFLLPSLFEGLPMSLLETMSFGLIPIVTAVGSIPTIVINRHNGIIIEKHNSNSIVIAIQELIDNDNYLTVLSKNAQKSIFNKFDDVTYIKTLNNLYINN